MTTAVIVTLCLLLLWALMRPVAADMAVARAEATITAQNTMIARPQPTPRICPTFGSFGNPPRC